VCNVTNAGAPNRFIATWELLGYTYRFTLTTLTSSNCPVVATPQSGCNPLLVFDCFDTIIGDGEGSLESHQTGNTAVPNPLFTNCSPPNCGQITFTFSDNGSAKTGAAAQPPPFDFGEFTINDLRTGLPLVDACMICEGAKADYKANQRGSIFH
jgi:hypothetical protein